MYAALLEREAQATRLLGINVGIKGHLAFLFGEIPRWEREGRKGSPCKGLCLSREESAEPLCGQLGGGVLWVEVTPLHTWRQAQGQGCDGEGDVGVVQNVKIIWTLCGIRVAIN